MKNACPSIVRVHALPGELGPRRIRRPSHRVQPAMARATGDWGRDARGTHRRDLRARVFLHRFLLLGAAVYRGSAAASHQQISSHRSVWRLPFSSGISFFSDGAKNLHPAPLRTSFRNRGSRHWIHWWRWQAGKALTPCKPLPISPPPWRPRQAGERAPRAAAAHRNRFTSCWSTVRAVHVVLTRRRARSARATTHDPRPCLAADDELTLRVVENLLKSCSYEGKHRPQGGATPPPRPAKRLACRPRAAACHLTPSPPPSPRAQWR